ncbi:MAG: 23S rRNA (adenine(2503)-C(2))-methyltransferase RlmN [Planctomycetaceae bacterium]|nr:23S rRNA (adenine(2503)-C(2))-methyltransferase RlmN [Planctomycetaceae bacterium]
MKPSDPAQIAPITSHPAPDVGPGRTSLFEFDLASLTAEVEGMGLPRRTAPQLLKWIYEKGVTDFERMSDLSKDARAQIAARFATLQGTVIRHQVATDDTQKLLVEWASGDDEVPAESALRLAGTATDRQTETVMIPAEDRRTACVSSQVGCPVGCRFCASGLGGLDGNLTAGRIVEQVWRLGRLPGVGRVSNVVFMGMGEPLANFNNVTQAIRILNAEWGLGIGARRITVSTVGLPPAIRKLCTFEIPVTLALSLHAPFDELRRQIIPWAEYSTIEELLDACQEWFVKTGREITLEYIMLGGVNDRREHAEELARLARTMRANVNLIRYNEVAGVPYTRPRSDDVHAFQEVLRGKHVNVHIRASRGRDIAAACGQLRHEARV